MTTPQLYLVAACIAVLLCALAWWTWRARQKWRADFLVGKTIIFNGQLGTITKYDGRTRTATVNDAWAEPPSDL